MSGRTTVSILTIVSLLLSDISISVYAFLTGNHNRIEHKYSSKACPNCRSSIWETKRESLSSSLAAGNNANEMIPLRQGSTVALVTPYTPNGSINFPTLRKLLQFHVESQTDGLCILGTTGEASLMTMSERESVLKIAVEEVKGKIPILVGTGNIDPIQTREMTQQAIDLGCDASLVVSPPYIKPPQRGLINHFTSIADMGLPVVIYNVPGRTGVDVTPETIAACAKHDTIVGVKEATGDVSRVESIRGLTNTLRENNPLLLYSGDDATEGEFVLKGGDGCISVTANLAPVDMHEMMMAALRGDEEETMRINKKLEMLHNRIFCESNPIPAKWALKRLGKIDCDYCRPPLASMDDKYYPHVEEALKFAGLI